MRNRRKMIIEVDRIRNVGSTSPLYATWCRGCRKDVDLVTFHEAAKITGTNLATIIGHAAEGSLHLGIRPEAMLVCLDSLFRIDGISFGASVH